MNIVKFTRKVVVYVLFIYYTPLATVSEQVFTLVIFASVCPCTLQCDKMIQPNRVQDQ
jgi:hypothetical protein